MPAGTKRPSTREPGRAVGNACLLIQLGPVRQLTSRRRSWPAIIGGTVVAVSVAVASCVAALSGSPGQPGAGAASAAASGAGRPAATPAGDATAAGLTGSSGKAAVLNLPAPSGAKAGTAAQTVGPTSTSVPASSDPANAAGQSSTPSTPSPRHTTRAKPSRQARQQPSAAGAAVPRLVVPDVIAAVPGGVTQADLAKIRKLSQVLAVLPIAGARIAVNGRQLTVLGAPAAALRPWMPPATAVNQQLWSEFTQGELITTAGAALSLQLVSGSLYPVAAAVRTTMTFGTRALLGIAGVDAIVDEPRAAQLGLVRDVAVLINAPAADMTALTGQVKKALGAGSRVVRLVPVEVSTTLPVDTSPPKGKPASYMALFKESAAQYCPGLSWMVLAAIGQIESDDGANMGPSTAGALGPMQFLPSTWRIWGIDGFGDAGPPNIMNPLDAVPSAARLLCADGAARGGQSLRQAIFDYNHADWYVDEVLTLAGEYAREFG